MPRVSNAVFLSYASEDTQAAERIATALRAADIEVWFDKSELYGGDAWDRQIRDQIHDCRLFVAVISAHTETRDEGYFRREWRLAVERAGDMHERKAFLVPVVIDDTSERGAAVPEKFRDLQWSRLPGGETPSAFVDRIKRLLSPEVAATSKADIGGRSAQTLTRASSARSAKRPILAAAAVAVVGAATYLAHQRPWAPQRVVPSQLSPAAPTSATSIAFSPPPHSIAVLPFVNMSGDKEQEYFSDGLTEELIDHLAQSPDLKVIARTCSFQFKGHSEDVRTIAAKLTVANLLEGSVRRSGKTLRVTAQLVRASDGMHLWSQTYDRKLSDIFKVQAEIADTVTRALNITLRQDTALADAPPNIEAYTLVLQGNAFKQRQNPQDIERAIVLYRKAIASDSHYALPWARLGSAYLNQVQLGVLPPETGLPKARETVQHAIELNPGLILAHYTMAAIDISENDWASGFAEIKRMREIDPNDQTLLPSVDADVYRVWCRFPEAVRRSQEIADRDPLGTKGWASLAWAQYGAGQYENSVDSMRHVIALAPNFAGAHADIGDAFEGLGRYSEALAEAEKEVDAASRLHALSKIYWAQGNHTRSDELLKQLISRQGSDALSIASLLAYRGENSAALDWLEKAYERHEILLEIKCSRSWEKLRVEPRYQAMLEKIHMKDMPPLP